jgi:oxygen-independent coproporphyrinogen-3 oxidase
MDSKKFDCKPTGLYVHIPFCEAKCRYCGFYSEPIKNHDAGRLISAIISELNEKRCQEPFFKTVYIGGGSPSCLPGGLLLRVAGEITSKWPLRSTGFQPVPARPGWPCYEFTVEINPQQVDKAILSQLRTAGVNRLSIGAQSFNADELDFLGRIHSVDDIFSAVEGAKQAGFENIGLDLIFAIPGSSMESWKYALSSAINLDIQHISTYALTYEEGTPLKKAVAAGEVRPVDEETDRVMYETAIEELELAGFEQYEISNFAKPGFECRHNLNYWRNDPYIGIGPAAGSYWQGKRTLNIADIDKYIEAIEKSQDITAESETPNKIQVACETAVLNLRRRCGIDLKEFKSRTGFDAMEMFAEPIGKYRELGLIEMTDGRLFLTHTALPIADSVLCDFSDV